MTQSHVHTCQTIPHSSIDEVLSRVARLEARVAELEADQRRTTQLLALSQALLSSLVAPAPGHVLRPNAVSPLADEDTATSRSGDPR